MGLQDKKTLEHPEMVQAMPKMTYSVQLLTRLKRTSRATFVTRGLMYHDTQLRGEHNLLTLHSAQPLLKSNGPKSSLGILVCCQRSGMRVVTPSEVVPLGRRGGKELDIAPPIALWKPQAAVWCQALEVLTCIQDMRDQ